MQKLSIIITSCLLALIYACTYSESGVYHVDPIPDDPPEIWVTTNLDTMVNPTVTDSLEVVYDVDIKNGKFYQLEAYILNYLAHNSDTTNGSFWIKSPILWEPGIDTLHLYFYFSTNSNSLADIVELEFNVITLDYPIIFEEGGEE